MLETAPAGGRSRARRRPRPPTRPSAPGASRRRSRGSGRRSTRRAARAGRPVGALVRRPSAPPPRRAVAFEPAPIGGGAGGGRSARVGGGRVGRRRLRHGQTRGRRGSCRPPPRNRAAISRRSVSRSPTATRPTRARQPRPTGPGAAASRPRPSERAVGPPDRTTPGRRPGDREAEVWRRAGLVAPESGPRRDAGSTPRQSRPPTGCLGPAHRPRSDGT